MREARIDENKLNYNTLLINGYNSYQNKEYQKALQYYQQAEQLSTDTISSPLVKCIVGVLYMHNCNYTEAISSFDSGLRQIKTSQFRTNQSLDVQYETAAITIKLQANLALCYLVLGQYRQSIEQVSNCIKILKQASDKNVRGLYESLVYIFYRFHNFSVMRNADFDSLETKYDDYSQACFYSTMAINKELCQSSEQAYTLQKKSLEIWTNKKQTGFMLVTTKHLLTLARELNMGKKVISDYEKLVDNLLKSDELEGISEKTLFKGFEQKMKHAKTITNMLIAFEKDQLKYRSSTQDPELKDWKTATKLKLQRAIRQVQQKIKNTDAKSRSELKLAIQQMKQTLLSLQTENNTLIQRNLQRSKFVIDAVNSFDKSKRLVDRLCNIANRHLKDYKTTALSSLRQVTQHDNRSNFKGGRNKSNNFTVNQHQSMSSALTGQIPQSTSERSPGFRSQMPRHTDVKEQKMSSITQQQYNQTSRNIKQTDSKYTNAIVGGSYFPSKSPNKNTSYMSNVSGQDQVRKKRLRKYIQICQKGQYFQKRNFSSDGGELKYVMITKSQIRWTADENKIQKKGQYQVYALKDIRGIIYGKQTQTFHKSCNKKLLPWRCFSLVLQKRTFDLCAESDLDIAIWVPGLSEVIKKAHPETKDIKGYSPGRVLWKKMWIKLSYYFIQPLKKMQKRTYWFERAEALRRFKQNGYAVPKNK